MSEKKRAEVLEKISSGIEGFDDITGGGLLRGRTTLLMGEPGCGKTVLALQSLLHGATSNDAPGIFVAFEENTDRVQANARSFGWNLAELKKDHLYFLNAHFSPDVVKAGTFDLTGLLAELEAKAREMGAKFIVFDALDVLLNLLDDRASERREVYRVHAWLTRTGLTGILTTKVEDDEPASARRYGFMQFVADCVVLMRQRVLDRVAFREMRVLKYRGSTHVLNEVPFVIGPAGIEVNASNGVHPEPQPFTERISTGIVRLDEMLSGGIYRGTNALLTGSAGAGKSTLSGLFVQAACRRGERALFVTFDENARDIMRDLSSVGVDLAPHLDNGLLRIEAVRTEAAASEDHLMLIKNIIREHQPDCVAIDPLSALVKVGGERAARSAAERLIYLCRNARITVLFTSLLEGKDAAMETTPLHVSTLADTWIQISYVLHGGERNRELTIIKSRGSKHSNQVRELIFSNNGITLADPYMAGGEVLMGTLRIEKENAVAAEHERLSQEIDRLSRARKTGRDESTLREDSTVRERDSKTLTMQAEETRPVGGGPRGRAKVRRKQL